MVGVPGKSKGCKTCKLRKIKCDLAKPSCIRCLRTGRQCEGYDVSPIFVNRSSTSTSGPVRYEKPALTGATERVSQDLQLVSLSSSSSSSNAIHNSEYQDPAKISTTYISDAALNAEQLTASFLSSWLPRSRDGHRYACNGGFFVRTMCETRKAPSLQNAIQAFAMTRLGAIHHDEELKNRGRQCYGVALRKLQKALYDPKLMLSDQTMATSSVLGLYELWEGTSSVFGWNGHADGIANIIRLRGPRAWNTSLGKTLYDAARHNQMVQAIQHRRSSFLGSSEWTYGVWDREERSLDERLFDIGYKIADLHPEMDLAKARLDGHLDVECCVDFLTRCDRLDWLLDQWYADYKDSEAAQGALYWVKGSASSGTIEEDVVFGPQEEATSTRSFAFINERIGGDLMHYWAIRLFVSLNSLFSLLELPVSPANGTRLSPGTDALIILMSQRHTFEERVMLARNILRSIDFMLADDQGLHCAQRVIFPLRVAMAIFHTHQHIPGAAEDLALCKQKNEHLAYGKGLRYAGELTKDGRSDKWSHRTLEYVNGSGGGPS